MRKTPVFLLLKCIFLIGIAPAFSYEWTTDHMQVGVRWQPSSSRPLNNAYELTRPILAEESSYVMFGLAAQVEPTPAHTDYKKIRHGAEDVRSSGEWGKSVRIKGKFVFFGSPSWASEPGPNGGKRPKIDHFNAFLTRLAKHFKGRVHSYQLGHETNLKSILPGADVDFHMKKFY